MVEYEAITTRLELALHISITNLTNYGNFELIVKQLLMEYNERR